LEAATQTQYLAVPRRLFEWLVRDLPALHHAADRSREAQRDRLRRLAWTILAPAPRARVCALLDLASRWAPCEPIPLGGHVLILPLEMADIGDLLALTPGTVDRAFQALELEGLIRREGPDRIVIPRPLQVRREAAMPETDV
jgi:CRP-like cAMP-binding protein